MWRLEERKKDLDANSQAARELGNVTLAKDLEKQASLSFKSM